MIAQSRPRFRTDLVAQPIDDEGGERFVDVTDPNSGKTFRFYEVEYSIACAMNGQRDLSGLAMWAQMELGLQPSSDELQTVINTLADLGYLAEDVPVQIDDLTLGQAGTNESLADELPPSANVELGTAGNEGVGTEEQTFVAPSLSLGHAGNERVATTQPPELKPKSPEPSFAGLMDDDEDQVPTQIKRPGQVTGSQPAEATLRPVGGLPDADDDGPTNLPPPAPEFDDEMSVDLSDHLHLGPDAVKEAVRQSQLMQSVEAPESAGNDSPPPLPKTPVVADADRTTELPDKPIQVSKPVEPVRDTAPKSRTGLLLLVLLLVLVGGAAAVYSLNLFDIRTKLGLEEAAETTPEQEEAPTPTPPPEKKPELPSATLVLGDAPVVEFKAPEKGSLATIMATDTEVKEGDVVAKLKGTASIDKQIAAHKLRQEHYQGKLDKAMRSKEEAEKDGNAGAARKYQSEVDEYQRKVDEKQGLVEAKEEKLEAFLFKAPAGGRVETSLKEGDSFDAGAVVFSIKGEPPLQATFTVKEDYAKDAEVEIVAKADDKKRLDCKVIEAEGAQITVECASGGALSADEEVILRP